MIIKCPSRNIFSPKIKEKRCTQGADKKKQKMSVTHVMNETTADSSLEGRLCLNDRGSKRLVRKNNLEYVKE